jgi:hypothetical protein
MKGIQCLIAWAMELWMQSKRGFFNMVRAIDRQNIILYNMPNLVNKRLQGEKGRDSQ